MADVVRVLAALVLVALSIVVWRWLQGASATGGSVAAAAAADKKKPSKKKPAKKKKKASDKAGATAADASASTTTGATLDASAAAVAASAGATNDDDNNNDDEEDSSDEDAGLTAKQILARRRFKPKAIGGSSAAATAAASAAAVSAARFQAGQRVVARFQGGAEWFPGVILEVRRGNEYHVKYDDGEVEHHVPHARIQDEAAAAAKKATEAQAAARGPFDARGLNADADDEVEGADVSSDEDDGDDGAESEDGWHVVEKTRRPKAAGGFVEAADTEKVDADGLTKRQREARRKKERKKEQKEQLRAQAQEHGLHARWGGTMSRLKYVPPPPGAQAPPS